MAIYIYILSDHRLKAKNFTFRMNVQMSIIPPHHCFCFALHLEWSLNKSNWKYRKESEKS